MMKKDTKTNKNNKQPVINKLSAKQNMHKPSIQVSIPQEESIENLKSMYYQLEYLNLLTQKCFKAQKETAEKDLLEKVNYIIKLRESNFNLSSKLNNLQNISKIEEYLSMTYNKILSIQPKISNVIENIDDLKQNVNYGLDRLYLEDNIVCDENELKKNLDVVSDNLEKLNIESKGKFDQVGKIKENYQTFYDLIKNEKKAIEGLAEVAEDYEKRVLDENMEKIDKCLEQENKILKEELLNK